MKDPEIVIGLVGPIGVNTTIVVEELSSALKSVEYTPIEISLSKAISDLSILIDPKLTPLRTLKEKIDAGNRIRDRFSDPSILAKAAIQEIRTIRTESNRKKFPDKDESDWPAIPLPRYAYIIRQLKRPEEADLLASIYGRQFSQWSIVQSLSLRRSSLYQRCSSENEQMPDHEILELVEKLIRIDQREEGPDHGQLIEQLFPKADFFVDASSNDNVSQSCKRSIEAFFGNNSIGPTRDEHGSYFAKAESLRSVDLSRQVGAAIFSPLGDFIAAGCNEVPKPHGGNYWHEDTDKHRDIDEVVEANKNETNRIVRDLLELLHREEKLSETPDQLIEDAAFYSKLKEARIFDITEYGRMVHAEMNALSDAARLGRSVNGATVYVTTFPCHNCAKHLVAAGIHRIVYIEPYPKSRTLALYSYALEETQTGETKVCLEHFSGISPKRYRDIFEKGRRRNLDGTISKYRNGAARPSVPLRSVEYASAELAYVGPFIQQVNEFTSREP